MHREIRRIEHRGYKRPGVATGPCAAPRTRHASDFIAGLPVMLEKMVCNVCDLVYFLAYTFKCHASLVKYVFRYAKRT